MGTNFMPPLNHAFKETNVLFTPIDFSPRLMITTIGVNRVSVGDEDSGQEWEPHAQTGNAARRRK
jgi:hypothetical protein